MLPQHTDEDKDSGDEDECECYLRDRPRGEGFDIVLGSILDLLMPARECGKEDEDHEGKNDGDDSTSLLVTGASGITMMEYIHEVGKHNTVFKGIGHEY